MTSPITGLERVRLWFSYQRYVFVLAGLPIVPTVLLLWSMPGRWYLWAPFVISMFWFVPAAVVVYRRFPKKLRATMVARRRMAKGRFRVESVRNYCTDPCFKVVAREILREANVPSAERKRLVQRFSAEKRSEGEFILFVDRTNGVQVRVEGSGVQNWPRPQ